MASAAGPGLTEPRRSDAPEGAGPAVASGLVVLVGAVLIVLTALQQPYNQNEWVQLAPYGSPDLVTAVTGTRQPPLDPFLGVIVQRLLGEGHLLQRVVPIASGIGSLVLVALLLRRLRLGWMAPAALLLMATAPLFLRYSAYTRPYALPVFLMLACAVTGSAYLDSQRRRWLVVALILGFLLPLSRVPEPTVFLVGSALVLLLADDPGRRARNRPLAGVLLLGLLTAGLGMLWRLLSVSGTRTGDSLIDTDVLSILARAPAGFVEIWTQALPRFVDWFPWWPLTLAVVLAGLLVPSSRRRLLGSWYWLPLALAPLVFLVVFHTVVPLELRDYRVRFAYFAVPPLVLLVGVAGHALDDSVRRLLGRTGGRPWLGAALVAVLVATQLPTTWRVLTEDDTIDLARAGQVMAEEVPADGVVVFDGPGVMGSWRQNFFGRDRFLSGGTEVVDLADLARGDLRPVARSGPVWLLLVDAECVNSVSCDLPPARWDGEVPGYRPAARLPYLTLYEPAAGQRGLDGLGRSMRALVEAYGARRAVPNAVVAARVLIRQDRPGQAAALLEEVCRGQPVDRREQCLRNVSDRGLGRLLEERGHPLSGPPARRTRA